MLSEKAVTCSLIVPNAVAFIHQVSLAVQFYRALLPIYSPGVADWSAGSVGSASAPGDVRKDFSSHLFVVRTAPTAAGHVVDSHRCGSTCVKQCLLHTEYYDHQWHVSPECIQLTDLDSDPQSVQIQIYLGNCTAHVRKQTAVMLY